LQYDIFIQRGIECWFWRPLLNLRNSNVFFLSNLILRWVITSNFDIRYWSKNQMELG